MLCWAVDGYANGSSRSAAMIRRSRSLQSEKALHRREIAIVVQ